MKSLILVRGLPGSGKTTLSMLLSEGKYPVISADEYFERNGNYEFDFRLLGIAHQYCICTTEKHMSMSVEKIFVANTFVEEFELDFYFELAKTYGYSVYTIIVENRHGSKNVHDVPEESIEKRRKKFSIKL